MMILSASRHMCKNWAFLLLVLVSATTSTAISSTATTTEISWRDEALAAAKISSSAIVFASDTFTNSTTTLSELPNCSAFSTVNSSSSSSSSSSLNTTNEFYIGSLGNASAPDSLYRTIEYDSIKVLVIKGFLGLGSSFQNLPVRVGELANALTMLDLWLIGYSTDEQEDQYFGRNGEYTTELINQHALLTQFWRMENEPPVLLVGLHSDRLSDVNASERAVFAQAVLVVSDDATNIPDEELTDIANMVRLAIDTELPDTYSNPVLSFNAYAAPRFQTKGYENSSVITIGDGILDYAESLGYGEVGSDCIHAHEFGHALQFVMDLEDVGGDYTKFVIRRQRTASPETTRQYELEADAMAAYSLAHPQGRNLPVSVLVEASKTKYSVGDCSTNNVGHHGTPKQRECAVLWGADEGLDLTGDPISMRAFRELYLQNYERILALDPSVCSLSDDGAENIGTTSSIPTSPTTPTVLSTPTNDSFNTTPTGDASSSTNESESPTRNVLHIYVAAVALATFVLLQ